MNMQINVSAANGAKSATERNAQIGSDRRPIAEDDAIPAAEHAQLTKLFGSVTSAMEASFKSAFNQHIQSAEDA